MSLSTGRTRAMTSLSLLGSDLTAPSMKKQYLRERMAASFHIMKSGIPAGLSKIGLALMVCSLFLPWIRVVNTLGKVPPSTYSPPAMMVRLVSLTGSCPAQDSPLSCVAWGVCYLLFVEVPVVLAFCWGLVSVWRPSYGMTGLAGLASAGLWILLALEASGGPTWKSWPDVGVFVWLVGTVLFLAARLIVRIPSSMIASASA